MATLPEVTRISPEQAEAYGYKRHGGLHMVVVNAQTPEEVDALHELMSLAMGTDTRRAIEQGHIHAFALARLNVKRNRLKGAAVVTIDPQSRRILEAGGRRNRPVADDDLKLLATLLNVDPELRPVAGPYQGGGMFSYNPCEYEPDCPPLPDGLADEFEAVSASYYFDEDDDDEIFDAVYDFITSHDKCPREHDEEYPDDPEIDTECARIWTYKIMEATGREYGTNAEPEDNPRGGWLRGLATAGLAALGIGGAVAGERLRRKK